MAVSPDQRRELMAAIRDAAIKVIGHDLLKNDHEAQVLTAIVRAYGNSPAGFIYAAPSRAKATTRPPDVVLCHPQVGLMVIECKGLPIKTVEGVDAGSIYIRRGGFTRTENPVRQAEDQMFDIDNAISRVVRKKWERPLTNCMVALPLISESEWAARGYDRAHPSSQLLFQEQIEDVDRLRRRVGSLVQETLANSRKDSALNLDQIQVIAQVFGNSDVINEMRPPREDVEKESLGGYIDEMMALEKYLSEEQKELSRLTVGEYPRLIRGVAGSGKSIVLANLVSRYLHRRLPSLEQPSLLPIDVKIAVTCFNQSLVEFLRRKVHTAYREQTLQDQLPKDSVFISHLNGLMYNLINARKWPLEYIQVEKVSDGPTRAQHYRDQIARFAQNSPADYHAACFDALFLDEGQDLEPEEYRLLLDLVRPHPVTGEKPLIIFYDDAQNLYGRRRPIWRDLGINVAIGDRSRVMRECFRNSRPIVELAFNVLLGSQASEEVRVQTRQYADVAYLKERGLVEEVGDHVRVGFAEREGNKPVIQSFAHEQAELDWVADEIVRLVRDEQVRPDDILVTFYSTYSFNHFRLEARIQAALPDIRFVHPFGKSADKRAFIFQPGAITVSTVHGAKGYDAPIVFVVGADRFDYNKEGNKEVRAAFYVAATRAKMLLYITGVERRDTLLWEAQSVCNVI
ncbi:MAG: 3'-5' exonuclease [Litorilinea sp.]